MKMGFLKKLKPEEYSEQKKQKQMEEIKWKMK